MSTRALSSRQQAAIDQVERYGAHNYSPLPVVIAGGSGAHVTDLDGTRYLDCISAYSALNFGHRHPALIAAATEQMTKVTLTSRAFFAEPYGPFVEALARLCGKQMVLPMNTGVEAVETAIKAARKWGYEVKGVAHEQANIIVMGNNFHGRTVTVVSFSGDQTARKGYGPFTPGFRTVPFGDGDALAAAIDRNTVAVLLEPIQGEAGVVVPPRGYLRRVRALTKEHDVLMIADEIQSGLGRAGATLACAREDVAADIYLLGKALGGGIVPLSAVVADADVLGVFRPGQHGSTFGGNPLACAIGSAVVELLQDGHLQEQSRVLGERLRAGMAPLVAKGHLTAVRGAGLWLGLDVEPSLGTARDLCTRLMAKGILAKDTHTITIRLAPPLVITAEEVDEIVAATAEALGEAAAERDAYRDDDADAEPAGLLAAADWGYPAPVRQG